MMLRHSLSLAALLAAAPAAALDDQELAALLGKRMHGDRSGACIAAAVIDETVARAWVCADPKSEPRIGPDTAFEIGSISKTMAAALLAEQILAGKAALDDPLSKHLPEDAQVPEFAGQAILLRHVVTHSSGLPALPARMAQADINDPYAKLSEADLLASVGEVQLQAAPGSQFEYSNFASMLLSLAVTRIAEQDLSSLLKARLFEPLNMRTAHLGAAPEGVRAAQGHMPGGRHTSAWNFQPNLAGVGGVRATLEDMIRYAEAQIGRSESAMSPALTLSQQAIDGVPRPMAMNWMLAPLDQRRVHVHEGGTGGFSAFIALDIERQRAVVVLSDTAMTSMGGLGSVGNHLLDARLPLGAPRKLANASADLLEQLVGSYQLSGGMKMQLRSKGGLLEVQAEGQPAFEMGYDSAGDFFPLAFDALLTPRRTATGMAFTWSQSGATLPATRLDPDAKAYPAPSAEQLAEFVGEYPLSPAFAIVFSIHDQRLHAQATGQGRFALEAAAANVFVAPQFGIEIEFERDAAGVVTAMVLRQGGQVQRAPKN